MRTLVLSLTLSLLAAGGPQRVATQDVAPVPRTPWGDPDLQGLWNYSTNTFLQRHPDHADREWLTEEEIAAANLEWSTVATSERRSELTPEYDLSLNFNQVWWDLGNSTGRTSLITDPSNGRLPPLTPEQEAYRATPEWQRLQQSEMGLRTRCLLDREVPIRPSSDNDNVHILQAPGYVVIFYEKIHSVRIIPVTDQPGVTGRIRQWLKRFSDSPCTAWARRGTSACTNAGGPMQAYSMDLRERALLDSDAGMKAADVAVKYRVSGSWVRLLKQRRRETGEVAPRVQRHGRRRMLEPHLHTLAALIAEQPDRTVAELKDALGTPASLATIWRAVAALDVTVKKNGPALRTRST